MFVIQTLLIQVHGLTLLYNVGFDLNFSRSVRIILNGVD